MDGGFGFGFSHQRQKRSHAQLENEDSASPSWESYRRLSASHDRRSPSHPHMSGLHLPRLDNMSPRQHPQHFPGDGFDYRRPASLSANSNISTVIDLTADEPGPSSGPSENARPSVRAQRPPRFAREIIDLDLTADDDGQHPSGPHPTSPEVEFVSSRRIDPPRRPTPDYPPHLSLGPDEDDLEIIGVARVARRQPSFQRLDWPDMLAHANELLGGVGNEHGAHMGHLRAALQRRVREGSEIFERRREPAAPPRARGRVAMFVAPTMGYDMVGFNLGLEETPPSPPPTYTAPPDAPQGFTRSPTEDDVLLCPNCGDELCTGDSDLKKQVWIVKKCGHVYCGECTKFRAKNSSRKGKEKAEISAKCTPFKVCAVDGCEEKTQSRQSMFQIFL